MASDTQRLKTKSYVEQGLREGLMILCVAVAGYLLVALSSYHPADPGWTTTGKHADVTNNAGRVGAWIADVLLYFFGYVAYIFPLFFILKAFQLFRTRHEKKPINWFLVLLRSVGVLVLVLSTSLLLAMYSIAGLGPNSGGVLGDLLASATVSQLNIVGGTLLAVAFWLIGFSQATGLSWLKIMDWVGIKTLSLAHWMKLKTVSVGHRLRILGASLKKDIQTRQQTRKANLLHKAKELAMTTAQTAKTGPRKEPVVRDVTVPAREDALVNSEAKDQSGRKFLQFARKKEAVLDFERLESEPAIESGKKIKITPFQKKSGNNSQRAKKDSQPGLFSFVEGPLPPITVLDAPELNQKSGFSKDVLESLSRLLEVKLADFGVVAEVVEVNPGPVITRFEIQPAAGVKVSKISNLAKDLARSLAMISVRVVDVIPGKSVVGIEVPNENRQMVRLREVLSSPEYDQSDSPLSLGLGNDIAGNPVVENLAKMPHLLVAGTTGSGKSVGVNAMLLSMLFKATPEQLRLIMIDPKMLELSIYDGIPHLLTPVVTDMKEAANALRWCVGEMERRYRLMAAMGVRNLAGFNKKVKDAEAQGEPLTDPLWKPADEVLEEVVPPLLETLPFIVVVVDEFADMMMIVGKKVEELIARIAQKARAAGIHLILATQRPSVDVITGLIKANVPTRIAFQVSSKIDSRTIIDQGGADQLLGHGDMLYMPPGTSIPVRVHGAFVADDEVHRVVSDWKQRGEPDYLDEILEGVNDSEYLASMDGGMGERSGGEELDELFDQAVAFVTETRRASISSVQRKLKIGYNRAANMVEAMEAAGVVSAAGHNGAREVIAPPPPRID